MLCIRVGDSQLLSGGTVVIVGPFLDGAGCFEAVGGPLLAFGPLRVGIGHCYWPSRAMMAMKSNVLTLRRLTLYTISRH